MALRPLSSLEKFRFSPGTFDVRKFEVRTRNDDENVGKVDDVLVDENGSARYLDVDLGLLRKHVLLPVGQAEVDASEDVVWVTGMSKDQFEDIPEWPRDTDRLDVGYESRLGRAYSEMYRDDRYYDRPEYNASWWRGADRGVEHEAAASADVGTTRSRLRRLSELDDYEVAGHDPDPRGWDVRSADGRRIGKVQELIVDPSALKVRYLDIGLDASALDLKDGDRHVLVPVGYADLDEDEDAVVLATIRSTDIAALPAHTGEIRRQYEDEINERYSTGLIGENRYAHPRYRTAGFYAARAGTRAPDSGRRGESGWSETRSR